MEEEHLARCETCGFISQESVVRRHINEVHQPVYVEYADDVESDSFSNLDELEPSELRLLDETNTQEIPETENTYTIIEKLHWTHSNVKLLLSCYEEYKHKFEDKSTPNRKTWNLISQLMAKKGYTVTPQQCENKFKNMKKTYKKIVDNNSNTGRGAIHWDYYDLMDALFRKNPEVIPLSTCSNLEGSSINESMMQSNKENLDISNSANNVNISTTSTSTKARNTKRKSVETSEEPVWFKIYREETQQRHREKMERQDQLLQILKRIADRDN